MNFVKLSLVAGVLALGVSVAFAQTTTTPAAPKAPAATTPAPSATTTTKSGARKQPQSPEAVECSAEADQKNLHGKPRVAFRKKCVAEKRAAMKKG